MLSRKVASDLLLVIDKSSQNYKVESKFNHNLKYDYNPTELVVIDHIFHLVYRERKNCVTGDYDPLQESEVLKLKNFMLASHEHYIKGLSHLYSETILYDKSNLKLALHAFDLILKVDGAINERTRN